MRVVIVVATLFMFWVTPTHAINRCDVGGKTVYQDQPCPTGTSRAGDAPFDREKARIEEDRARSATSERQQAADRKASAASVQSMTAEQRVASISQLTQTAAGSFKDPSSVQFENLTLGGPNVLCGNVNARNSLGGYVGFKPFLATPIGVATWRGACPKGGDIDSRIDCVREQNAYIIPAIREGCITQQEANLLAK